MDQKKESYTEPVMVTHALLRDVTGSKYQEKTTDKLGDNVPT